MKKVIGINIDGILRNYLDKFEKVYISTYISNPSLIETNEEMTEVKILTEDEEIEKGDIIRKSIEDKIKKPIDSSDLLNHFHFDGGKNYIGDEVDSKGKLDEFMYELKAFNIFGQADSYQGSIDSFHKLQMLGEKEGLFDVVLLSTLRGKGITATYSFLANNGCRARRVIFLRDDFEKWDHCDILFDIAPEAIQSKPDDKLVIKIEQDSNKWDSGDFNFPSLKDALKSEELTKSIMDFCELS